MFANRSYVQIFPVSKDIENLDEWGTENLNISFNLVDWFFLPFQNSKFQKFRKLNDNGDDKLVYTISCLRKIMSQFF